MGSLKKYLYYLNEGEVLINLYPMNKFHKDFQKPQKILLNNTNFSYAFSINPSIGTVRETFVAKCLFLDSCGDKKAKWGRVTTIKVIGTTKPSICAKFLPHTRIPFHKMVT
jgi:hypothetical protein